MKNNIKYHSYSGTVILNWNRSQFPQISKVLNLEQQEQHLQNIKVYSIRYGAPYNCKLTVYQNGRLKITGGDTPQTIQSLFQQCILSKLMDNLQDVAIRIENQLKITSCCCKFNLSFQLNISQIQNQLKKQYGIVSRNNYTYLPPQVHGIERISVLLGTNIIKITKANLIKDINLFISYLQFVLKSFELKRQPKVTKIDKYENKNSEIFQFE